MLVIGSRVREYRTVAELVADGHVPKGFEWMDPYLKGILSVNQCLEDFEVTLGGGPQDPWEIAKREQEAARVRALARRDAVIARRNEMKVQVFQEPEAREKKINLKLTQENGSVVLLVVGNAGKPVKNGRIAKITSDGRLEISSKLNKDLGLMIGSVHSGIHTNFE